MERRNKSPVGNALRELFGISRELREQHTERSRAETTRMGLSVATRVLSDLELFKDFQVVSKRIKVPEGKMRLFPVGVEAEDLEPVIDRHYYLTDKGQLVVLGHDHYTTDLLWDFKQFVVSDRNLARVGGAVFVAIQKGLLEEEGRQAKKPAGD
jgi:hypothetical protein